MKDKQKILLVFGTRPEAIKMCPLVKEFQKHQEAFETKVCVTGQHREMLDQVLNIFDVNPDYDLNIMKQGQDLYDVTSRVLTGMRDVLKEVQPDVVLVHGDTTTSTAAALAAFYQQIPVGHVEAGLRTSRNDANWLCRPCLQPLQDALPLTTSPPLRYRKEISLRKRHKDKL